MGKKTYRQHRWLNGNVRNPGEMIVMVIMVGLFITMVAIFATIAFLKTNTWPNLVYKEVIIDKIQQKESSTVFITAEGNYVVGNILVNDYSSIERAVQSKEVFYTLSCSVPGISGKREATLWGMKDSSGTVYIDPEAVKAHQSSNLAVVMYGTWGIVIIYMAFTFCGWFLVSNAPKYPRLAALFIKKDYRNF